MFKQHGDAVAHGTDALHFKLLDKDKLYKERFEKSNSEWQLYAQKHNNLWNTSNRNGQQTQAPPDVTTLTVVFHDLTNSNTFLLPSGSPITGYQYIVDNLNLIYNGTNLNGTAGNNTFIQFCLARRTQNNVTYTTAMSHHSGVANAQDLDNTQQSQIEAVVGNVSVMNTFNPANYINIYIVDSILGGVAGFATLPSSHGNLIDGIYVERQFLENNASINTNMNVLAHEMGHYLGLFHTFGICSDSFEACSCDNTNCLFNGDMICDTPPNQLVMNSYTAGAFPNTCTDIFPPALAITDGNHPIVETVDPKDNYMDYGIWLLQNNFTDGQITRMHFMIDAETGARKSLLGQAVCVNCESMNSCVFNLSTSPVLSAPRNYIAQNANFETPPVQMSLVGPCIASMGTDLNYSWSLQLLGNPNVAIAQGTGLSYTTPATLAVGVYELTLNVILTADDDCVISKKIVFSVIPPPGTCNVVVPNSNSNGDWSTNNWDRRSVSNGWVMDVFNSTYPPGSTQATSNQGGFDASGFDVIPLSAGNSISTVVDPILGGIPLPFDANVSRVMRVGKLMNGGGQAFYAKRTITINRNNCRFRVWYLGATQGNSSRIQYPFHNEFLQNDASFGFLTRYRYNSPVNTVTTSFNTQIGYDDVSLGTKYEKYDLVSLKTTNSSASLFQPYNIAPHNGYSRMFDWQSVVLDYSEFVDLANDTEITLTFFSHSNIANPAHQNAYAYYGIECLGGGLPQPFEVDLQNIAAPCASPGDESCAFIPVPIPAVVIYPSTFLSTQTNFASIRLDRIDELGNVLDANFPFVPTMQNGINGIRICLTEADVPHQDFRITYRTLHDVFVDDFRIFVSFYNNIPDCTTGDQVDLTFHPGTINGDILLCGSDNLPSLHLTPTCITQQVTYQWYRKNNINNLWLPIQNANNEILQLAYTPSSQPFWPLTLSSNYSPFECNFYKRIASYREAYCDRPKTKESEEFHVYNSLTMKFNFSAINDQDICFGESYTIEFINPYLNNVTYSCQIPDHFDLSGFENDLFFQLFDPDSNALIGDIFHLEFNGAIPNQLLFEDDFILTFDNIDTLTGDPIFVPTATGTNQFPINLHITGHYLGCPVDIVEPIDPLQHSGSVGTIGFTPSAVGGLITYDCSSSSIQNSDMGITFGGYGWEYSVDNVNYFQIPGNPTSSSLASSFYSSLPSPLFIRRISYGDPNTECTDPDFSNVVLLTNHPNTIQFSLPTSICYGGVAPALPTTSSNGIIGTWNVLIASNTVSDTYTFTPLQGYCLPPYEYTLTITNGIAPQFTQIAPICSGEVLQLPSTSNNGVSGVWSPVANNTATTTYTFFPISGNCNDTVTMTVIVNPLNEIVFDIDNVICQNATPPELPTQDQNGITGTWDNPIISNVTSGSYTFTPDASFCAAPYTLNVNVLPAPCGFTISWGTEVSCQLTFDDPRIKEADIVDGPCLRFCENSIITYTINGSTPLIDFTEWNITGGTVLNSTDTTIEISWDSLTLNGSIQAEMHLLDGSIVVVNKCIEKLNSPIALFDTMPAGELEFCKRSPIIFENLTQANGGHEVLYYSWDFGDGTTSNEFEPIHEYDYAGFYTVTLFAFNGCSCVSKYTLTIEIKNETVNINCASVACEDEVTSYFIHDITTNGCSIHWEVDGGTIVGHNNNNTLIDVLWDNVNPDGFGYVSFTSDCIKCPSIIKVPVVLNEGQIVGSEVMCPKTQGLYSLPKWPTTEFTWTLQDNGTNATLFYTNQRNEVLISSQNAGSIDLYCTYFNTLLGCGGTAHKKIYVKSGLNLVGQTKPCVNQTVQYELVDWDSNSVTNVDWTMVGPDNFEQSGTGFPLNFTFTNDGIHILNVYSMDYCAKSFTINVNPLPAMPSTIDGSLIVCPSMPYTYTCAAPTGFTTHWEVVNGTIVGSSTGNSITVLFDGNATTPYGLDVWFQGEFCASDTQQIIINKEVPDLSIVDFQSPVCGSSAASYSVNDLNADSYTWTILPETAGSVEEGQNSNEVSILWNQPTGSGNAQIRLVVQKCGSFYEEFYDVQVINSPIVNLSGATNACTGQSAPFSFTLSPTGVFDHAIWDFGDGSTEEVEYVDFNSFSTVHSYNATLTSSTNYLVTLTVFGAGGCIMSSTDTFSITVSPSPQIYISPANDLNVCGIGNLPSSYTYTVNMQGGFASTDTIQWYYQTGGTTVALAGETSSTINLFGDPIGTYFAEVTNVFGCTAATQSINMYSDCTCPAPFNTDAVAINTGCQSILLHATVVEGSPTSIDWVNANLPGATILNNSDYYFEAENIQPGEYDVRLVATYNVDGNSCIKIKNVPFIIPYKAGLKYTVECNQAAGNYTVTLLDYSVYFPGTPIEQFSFTYDGGLNWYPATVAGNNMHQLTVTLPPGNRQVGIKIKNSSYHECTYFETLQLPAMPNASFTASVNTCQGSAVQFNAVTQPDTQYHWDFGAQVVNLQQNPVRVFNGAGSFPVILTVTNKYGCSATSMQIVNILEVKMSGSLEKMPFTGCQGSDVTLHFTPDFDNDIPSSIVWYHNSVNSVPIATTISPNLDLIVNQSGQYIAYLEDANGCKVYTTPAITVAQIPIPAAPQIVSPTVVCTGSYFELSVPQNPSVFYQWTINGMPQPLLNNLHEIQGAANSAGTYVYSVTASISNGTGGYCTSAPTSHTVTIVDQPDTPIIAFQVNTCFPYNVTVYVTNVQNGVNYYWSNGGVGSATEMHHDGPIQVRAEANGCSVTAQIDLPIDLEAVAWVFPKGCFQNCEREPLGYIIGPFGDYENWEWLQNGVVVSSGSGPIDSFAGVEPTNDYQLFLDNGHCSLLVENLNIQEQACIRCDVRYIFREVNCIRVGDEYVYEIELNTVNPYPFALWSTMTVPTGQGYFVSSTIQVLPGSTGQIIYFHPMNGFSGGSIMIQIQSDFEDAICVQDMKVEFLPCPEEGPRFMDTDHFNASLLMAVPNPAKENTFIYYNYGFVTSGKLTIDLVDILGRKIISLPLQSSDGKVELTTSTFAAGQYIVVLKEDDAIVQQVKLLVND